MIKNFGACCSRHNYIKTLYKPSQTVHISQGSISRLACSLCLLTLFSILLTTIVNSLVFAFAHRGVIDFIYITNMFIFQIQLGSAELRFSRYKSIADDHFRFR